MDDSSGRDAGHGPLPATLNAQGLARKHAHDEDAFHGKLCDTLQQRTKMPLLQRCPNQTTMTTNARKDGVVTSKRPRKSFKDLLYNNDKTVSIDATAVVRPRVPSPPLWPLLRKPLTSEEVREVAQLHEAKLSEFISRERARIAIMFANRAIFRAHLSSISNGSADDDTCSTWPQQALHNDHSGSEH